MPGVHAVTGVGAVFRPDSGGGKLSEPGTVARLDGGGGRDEGRELGGVTGRGDESGSDEDTGLEDDTGLEEEKGLDDEKGLDEAWGLERTFEAVAAAGFDATARLESMLAPDGPELLSTDVSGGATATGPDPLLARVLCWTLCTQLANCCRLAATCSEASDSGSASRGSFSAIRVLPRAQHAAG